MVWQADGHSPDTVDPGLIFRRCHDVQRLRVCPAPGHRPQTLAWQGDTRFGHYHIKPIESAHLHANIAPQSAAQFIAT
jgi:hypothetical protein